MKNYLKAEIKHGIYSMFYLKMIILFTIFIIILQYLDCFFIMESNDNYNNVAKSFAGDFEAIQAELEKGCNVDVGKLKLPGQISNPIAYYGAELNERMNDFHPTNAVTNLEESSGVIIMLVFSVFGALYIIIDDKNKIKKHKTIRMSKLTYIKYKHISMIVSAFIIMIAGFIIGILSNVVSYNIIKTKVDMRIIDIEKRSINIKTEFIRVLVIVLVMLVFVEIGAFFATVFKSSAMSICIMCAYLFISNIEFKYGLLKCVKYLYTRVFDMNKMSRTRHEYINYNIGIVLFVIISVLTVSIAGNVIIENKRRVCGINN